MRLTAVAAVVVMVLSAGLAEAAKGSSPLPKKLRVAVLEFDVQDGSSRYGDIARDAVSTWLTKCGRFQMYDRASLKKTLREHGLAMTGIVDPSTAVQIGKFTGVQLVVCGSVQSVSSGTTKGGGGILDLIGKKTDSLPSTQVKLSLHCKAIDAQDGSIWKEDVVEGSALESGNADTMSLLPKATQEAAEKFVEQLVPPVRGNVVKVHAAGGYFIIDLGSAQGISERSEFKVEADGEVITDLNGKSLGRERVTICLAHPIRDGVSEKMTKLAPGEWKKEFLSWSWKEHRDWTSKVQRGQRVIAQPRQRG